MALAFLSAYTIGMNGCAFTWSTTVAAGAATGIKPVGIFPSGPGFCSTLSIWRRTSASSAPLWGADPLRPVLGWKASIGALLVCCSGVGDGKFSASLQQPICPKGFMPNFVSMRVWAHNTTPAIVVISSVW
eukprot:CAMPEP_0198230904 /NCGR_PEP_ID=MMETSP1445-20131203/114918_1 /TAXON_ID=36898 /ORGANISM="Pyramimonas sp., Strain CCMP2087" /LENGTH=130 /DNA_ID=CAMNT_0043911485 /DNA_START=765 /DNA_END=1154 /DNA_ORIENTATION=+